jgi:Ni,Fe-hydrogenase III component G
MYYNFQNFRTSKLKWPFPSRIVVKQVITAMAKIMVTEEQSREVVKRIYKYHETPEGYYLGKHEKVLRQTICYHLVKMWERTQILKQEKNITEKIIVRKVMTEDYPKLQKLISHTFRQRDILPKKQKKKIGIKKN